MEWDADEAPMVVYMVGRRGALVLQHVSGFSLCNLSDELSADTKFKTGVPTK